MLRKKKKQWLGPQVTILVRSVSVDILKICKYPTPDDACKNPCYVRASPPVGSTCIGEICGRTAHHDCGVGSRLEKCGDCSYSHGMPLQSWCCTKEAAQTSNS